MTSTPSTPITPSATASTLRSASLLRSRFSSQRLQLVLALLCLAAGLRAANIDRLDVWLDEAHTVLTATSPRGILAALHSDTNPPLYFYIMKLWIHLFGLSALAIRSFSLLAGIGTIAALGLWLRESGASWRTAAWTMALATVAPLQIHYSQEARSYSLACLLLTLSLWTFTRAANRGSVLAWSLHGLTVVASFYTHNLLVPIAAGFWMAAALGSIRSRKQWRAMILTYLAIALAAIPEFLLLFNQAGGSGGMAWIRPIWLATPPALAIPRSLEVLGLGGDMPTTLLWPSLPGMLHVLAIALTAILLIAAFWPAQKPQPNASVESHSDDGHSHRWLPVIFTLWPLLFLFLYSIFKTPIYVLARYDVLAQPAYLALLGAGLARLTAPSATRWRTPVVAGGLIAAAAFALMLLSLYARWNLTLSEQLTRFTHRGEYLQMAGSPDDLIICTGLEASGVLYQAQLRGFPARVISFPRETLLHPGWFLSNEALIAQHDQWPAEAAAACQLASTLNAKRLWIIEDAAAWNMPSDLANFTPRQALTALLESTAKQLGYHERPDNPVNRQTEAAMHIMCLER